MSQSGPLAPGQSVTGSASATIPLGDSGTYQIIIVADATNQLIEPGGRANSASQSDRHHARPLCRPGRRATSSPRADDRRPGLSDHLLDGHQRRHRRGPDEHAGPTRSSRRRPTMSPTRMPSFWPRTRTPAVWPQTRATPRRRPSQMPPGFTGRYHLFVETDADDVVFENGLKANNVAEAPNHFDVMPIPYADLVVSSIDVPQPAGSGLPVNVTWTVTNQGIGLTSVPSWDDDLALASDPAGKNIIEDYGLFNHLGPIGPAAATCARRRSRCRTA